MFVSFVVSPGIEVRFILCGSGCCCQSFCLYYHSWKKFLILMPWCFYHKFPSIMIIVAPAIPRYSTIHKLPTDLVSHLPPSQMKEPATLPMKDLGVLAMCSQCKWCFSDPSHWSPQSVLWVSLKKSWCLMCSQSLFSLHPCLFDFSYTTIRRNGVLIGWIINLMSRAVFWASEGSF
jgi:hypothetical protein